MEPPAAQNGFGAVSGVWYFAYGSNMNPKTLTGRRKVVPRESLPGVLYGWTLSFRMLGLPYAEPGFATIERVVNGASMAAAQRASTSRSAPHRWHSEVHGVLHHVSLADWTNIMTTEGVGGGNTGYRVVEVDVDLYDGRRVRALTLEGQEPSLHRVNRPVAPSRRYLDLLRDGARHHGLHPDYVAHLDAMQPYDTADWTAAAGKAVALAAALPLALPLIPPILMLRAARKQAKEAARVDGGSDGNDGAIGAVAAGQGGYVRAEASSASPVKAAVGAGASVGVTARATAAPAAPHGYDKMGGGAPSGQLPAELTRPPLVLPGVVRGYLTLVQNFAWGVHDYVAAPLLGSGSSGKGSNSSSNGSSDLL